MTAVLAPRMNVDNGFKIFKYNGIGPVHVEPIERAYDALWRPAPAGTYPDRGPSPKRAVAVDGAAAALAAKPAFVPSTQKYRPPGSRADSAPAFTLERDTAPKGKIGGGAASTGATSKQAAKPVPTTGGGKYVPQRRAIPGMAPPGAAPSSTTTAATSGGGGGKKGPPSVSTSSAKAAPAPTATSGDSEDPAITKEKRVKALKKKLKQIDELKAKLSEGKSADSEQKKKLDSEAELLAELRSLEI